MLETTTPEHLLHTRQKGKGKEKAKEGGIRLMKQENDFPSSDQYCPKQNHCYRPQHHFMWKTWRGRRPNKYCWGRSLAHFGSLLAATGQPAHASSKVQNTVNPNRGNWSKLQDFHLPAKAHPKKRIKGWQHRTGKAEQIQKRKRNFSFDHDEWSHYSFISIIYFVQGF